MNDSKRVADMFGQDAMTAFAESLFGYSFPAGVPEWLKAPTFLQETSKMLGVDPIQFAQSSSGLGGAALFGIGADEFIRSLIRTPAELSGLAHRFLGNIAEFFGPDFLERLESFNHAIREDHDLYVKLGGIYGWFLPGNVPYEMITELARISREGGNVSCRLRQFLVSAFQADGSALLKDLLANLRRDRVIDFGRWKILRDCGRTMESHARDRYNAAGVVLPALISITDGLLNDFARTDLGVEAPSLRQDHLSKIRQHFTDLDTESAFEQPARMLLFERLFATTLWGDTPKGGGSFNRHKILHGEVLRYGTAANVLRAFFIVDFTARNIAAVRGRLAAASTTPIAD